MVFVHRGKTEPYMNMRLPAKPQGATTRKPTGTGKLVGDRGKPDERKGAGIVAVERAGRGVSEIRAAPTRVPLTS